MTPTEALRQCRATLSLIDRADCKDDAVWQKVVDTQAEVDRVLRDGEPSAPTDISRQLRAQAQKPFGPEGFALLEKAAEEIERYYGGMKAWKATAESKDRHPAPSLQAVGAVPEGWKLVPRKLTEEQAREIVYNINRKYKGNPMSDYLARAAWEWGIYAAPNPPAATQVDMAGLIAWSQKEAAASSGDAIREKFETWARDNCPFLPNLKGTTSGKQFVYFDIDAQRLWSAFSAAITATKE